jgi:uncharacterized membrane protein
LCGPQNIVADLVPSFCDPNQRKFGAGFWAYVRLLAWEIGALGSVLLIIAVSLVSAGFAVAALPKWWKRRGSDGDDFREESQTHREYLAHALLFGLDLLVAAEIIETVIVTAQPPSSAVQPFVEIGQLGFIVLIRAFLGLLLRREMSG